MAKNHTAGGNIDAWCTKCKMELAHTIIVMDGKLPKKVKCNTCKGQHNFRKKPAEKKQTKPKGTSRKTSSKEVNSRKYVSLMNASDLSKSKKYSMTGNFEENEVIDHLTFGVGIVVEVVQIKKIEILFKDGPKLLIQNH